MFNKFIMHYKKLKEEYNELLNDEAIRMEYTSFGKESILVFVLLIFYSFFCIGSSINSSIFVITFVTSTIRLIFMLFGIVIIYMGIYLMFLQKRINNKPIFYIALVFGLLSTTYYIFVSYYSFLEIILIY